MSSFLDGLQELQRQTEKRKQESFWNGHSLFQIPLRVLAYKGSAEALVLTYFYERANSVSFYSKSEIVIEIPVRERTIAARTGLDEDTVSDAIVSLEADECIRVARRRDLLTKQIRLSVYLLLHSQTKNPLTASPGIFGVCHQNFEKPYITAPKETRENLIEMKRSGRSVYLAALSLASKQMLTSYAVRRDEWRAESLLGKNAFNRGLRECERKGLLIYKRQLLTLNDPKTRKPSERTAGGRIRHDNPTWQFDLNTVTAEQWQRVSERLLKRDFIVGQTGWTHATRESHCPFCSEVRSFRLNFGTAEFQCYRCERHGRLGQLVQQVLRVTQMQKAKEFIRESIGQDAQAVAA